MGIAKGSTAITAIRKGTVTIAKIMKGSTQIFAPGGGAPAAVIADPGFADAGYWSTDAAAISGGQALFNQPYVKSSPSVTRAGASYTAGATYNYSLTISNYQSGNVRPGMGWNTINYGSTHAANGTFTGTVVAGDGSGSNALVGLFGGADFIGNVDNFTLTPA